MADANETLKHLGGMSAMFMIGAKNIYDDNGALVFKFRGSKRANHVKISVNGLDLYDVEFTKLGRAPNFNHKSVGEFTNIPVENLREVFEKHTGLYLSL